MSMTPFVCPKCGGCGISRTWREWRCQTVLGVFRDQVVLADDVEADALPAPEAKEEFYCGACRHTWPAAGSKFTNVDVVQGTVRREEDLAAVAETHHSVSLRLLDVREGDLVDNGVEVGKVTRVGMGLGGMVVTVSGKVGTYEVSGEVTRMTVLRSIIPHTVKGELLATLLGVDGRTANPFLVMGLKGELRKWYSAEQVDRFLLGYRKTNTKAWELLF